MVRCGGKVRLHRHLGQQRRALRCALWWPFRGDRRGRMGRCDARERQGLMAVLQGSGAADAQGRGGSIINMASLATIYGMPFALHYTVSKAAVVGLTRGLARELGRDNIRVNSIAPSAVLTESTREFFGEKHERARGHCWRPGDPAQHSPEGRLWCDVVARLRAVRLRHRADHRGRWRDRDACSERSADAGERSVTTASACGAGSVSHRGMSGAFPPRRGRDRTP